MNTGHLNDRVVVVTGGAQGIGRALSLHLLSEGAHVVAEDRNEEGAVAVAREATSGHPVTALRLDVSDSESCEELSRVIKAYFNGYISMNDEAESGELVAVKDNIDVQGLATAAGAQGIGKTNMHEYAFGATNENVHYGSARNPHYPQRVPGGSAVVVGLELCDWAIGSDTGGLNKDSRGVVRCRRDETEHGAADTRVRIPFAMPSFVTALKISAPNAVLGVMTAGWIIGGSGLGRLVVQSWLRLDITTMWGAVLVSALVAWLLFSIVNLIERLLLGWAVRT